MKPELEKAIKKAVKLRAKWLAMDANGELWCGKDKPEYHQYIPIWIWQLGDNNQKVGWIYPVNNWKECRWQLTQ